MKSDIRKYLTLRDSLVQERAQLESRLREITEALGQTAPAAASMAPVPSRAGASPRRGRGRRTDGLSLREAVLQITSTGAKTKEEILNGVKQLGYKFSTNNPMNSLGVILYGKNPKFRNQDGRFSPAGGSSVGSAQGKGGQGQRQGRKRRVMSAEARERIAAAQRARWAKVKSGK